MSEQSRTATPSTDRTESDDVDWDVEDESDAEKFGQVADMANVLAIRALLNHMHVCLMNGDLDKTEALIQKALQFLDKVQDKDRSIGERIAEIHQQVAQCRWREREQPPPPPHREQAQARARAQARAVWPDPHGTDRYPAADPNSDPATGVADPLFTYLADDTRKPTGRPEQLNPHEGIDSYFQRFHQGIPYNANNKTCSWCYLPEEHCYCGIDEEEEEEEEEEEGGDDHDHGGDHGSTATTPTGIIITPPWLRLPLDSCPIDFVDPWKGPLHRNSDSVLLQLNPNDPDPDLDPDPDYPALPPRARSAPKTMLTTTGDTNPNGGLTRTLGPPPLASPPPAPPTYLLAQANAHHLPRRRRRFSSHTSSIISPKTIKTRHDHPLPSPPAALSSTSTSPGLNYSSPDSVKTQRQEEKEEEEGIAPLR